MKKKFHITKHDKEVLENTQHLGTNASRPGYRRWRSLERRGSRLVCSVPLAGPAATEWNSSRNASSTADLP